MSKKHYSPKTGKVENCKAKNGCPLGSDIPHGENAEEVMRQGQEYERKRAEKDGHSETGSMQRSQMIKIQQEKEKKEMLNAAVETFQSGFAAATPWFPDRVDEQVNFLKQKAIQKNFIRSHIKRGNDYSLQSLAHTVYANGDPEEVLSRKEYNEISDEDKKKIINKDFKDADKMDNFALARTATFAVSSPKAPLYKDVKKAIREHNANTPYTGYEPKEEKGHDTNSSSSIISKLGADPKDIPEGVTAFDIETDTSKGEGLNPHKGQITEIVFSDKEKTTVLYGDEKHILEKFRDHMNSIPANETLVGWSNKGFDNIFLNERAKAHNIEGWGGKLSDTKSELLFAPVDGFERGQDFTWTKPDGSQIKDEDGMAMLYNQNLADGKRRTMGLKKNVKESGITPIEVDRSKMHELSEKERLEYVGSDGIATLFAYKKIKDEIEEYNNKK